MRISFLGVKSDPSDLDPSLDLHPMSFSDLIGYNRDVTDPDTLPGGKIVNHEVKKLTVE